MPPRKGFEKYQWYTEIKKKKKQDLPSSNHPQTATDMGRHAPKSGGSCGSCVFLRIVERSKSQFHFHNLVHFCRKQGKENSLLLLHYDNVTIGK